MAVHLTRKVRRGLELARGLLIDSFDMDATPSERQVKSWTAKERSDFNAAMAWMEDAASKANPAPEPEVVAA